jgi:polysaccharide deacetylase family protein (PEP-CTERM system associated)
MGPVGPAPEKAANQPPLPNALTCELEDWFHILDSDRVPPMQDWDRLPLCAERNVERLLQLFGDAGVRATFFCLGWMAERLPRLVRRCQAAGHEIGSHGYAHLMASGTNHSVFREDIVHARKILEDITGREVLGFRSPGFSVRNGDPWFFDVVAESGYRYDASVFCAYHAHGGFHGGCLAPYTLETAGGPLTEIPVSAVRVLGCRVCFFGGGYLRISPLPLIRWGVRQLQKENRPLIVYVHPREIDPAHPRLPLGWWRSFKCYYNLRGTLSKLQWLCTHHKFGTMAELALRVSRPARRPMPEGEHEHPSSCLSRLCCAGGSSHASDHPAGRTCRGL